MNKEKNYYVEDLTLDKVGVGVAHGKIILMGEHAVVYDYPGIALPFPRVNVKVQAHTLKEGANNQLACRYYYGDLDEAYPSLDNIKKAFDLASQILGINQPLSLIIESTIPAGRGMGSSAAVCVALVRALFNLYDHQLSNDLLHYIVNEAEVIAHGSTSGLDTLMTSTNQAHIYRKSQIPVPFDFDIDAYLIVADSGKAGQTSTAVKSVEELMHKRPEYAKNIMESIGDFVLQAYQAIKDNDPVRLGRLMTYNHYYLNQLEVSTPRLDKIVNSAWMAGALGAKLTGGGLGGCLIALADSKESSKKVARAMEDSGACQTWIMDLCQS